jgi:hypothetical protein
MEFPGPSRLQCQPGRKTSLSASDGNSGDSFNSHFDFQVRDNYHGLIMHRYEKHSEGLHLAAGVVLAEAAAELAQILAEMASQLDPFPAFLNMMSVQAIELEPGLESKEDRGCLVICPDGGIRRLDLTAIPGVPGVADVDQLEQFEELDLPPEEYIVYAVQAVELLYAELRRRGL